MIKSILVWPKEIRLGWHESSENKSEDINHSEYSAKRICETLIRKGFGCDGYIFPEEARVEVDGVIKFQWREDKGYIIDDIEEESITSRYFGGRKPSPMF